MYAIFDLDDTLSGILLNGEVCPTYMAYKDAIRRFKELAFSVEVDPNTAATIMNELDEAAVRSEGFGVKERFAYSMVNALAMLDVTNTEILAEAFDIGRSVFTEYPYVPLDGALEVLEETAKEYEIVIVTKGERNEQVRKVNDSGILNFVRPEMIFVRDHKSDEEWEEILVYELLLGAHSSKFSWAIGNSAKADVNPPLKYGLNAIHLNDPKGWTFEHAEYGKPKPGRTLATISDIRESLQYLSPN